MIEATVLRENNVDVTASTNHDVTIAPSQSATSGNPRRCCRQVVNRSVTTTAT
jgi:hypothetical protein